MNGLNEVLPGIMSVLSLAAVLIVLLLTILKLLRAASFFHGYIAVVMALCISVLFIISFSQILLVPAGTYNITEAQPGVSVNVNHLLLACLALALASSIVLSQVLLLASKILPHDKSDVITKGTVSHTNKPKNTTAKSKPGRPRKVESKSPPALQKPAGKGKNEVKVNTSTEGTKT